MEEKTYDWSIISKDVQGKIVQYSLPKKPGKFGEEYLFPEDIPTLESIEIGRWLSKLAAWKGYALRMLANAEMDLSIIKGMNGIAVSQFTAENTDNSEKKTTKDYLLGKALDNPNFKKLRADLLKKEAEVAALQRIVELYSIQIDAISREISRRSLEIKGMQKGLGE